ncbi:uncharacterized protein LOC133183924 [Saccostrea echinata]|uniref:uncharacterized protein LOC133183924 n=1 Tax=Saccostrea echinata TaxID=191078 RepID=UPI002A835C0A|nr:uncharacterized protein LOC133183924 [Saccostrea echinata]
MGLLHSCMRKRSNKVGIMTNEEEEAYKKIEREIKNEVLEETMQKKPLPWLMFNSSLLECKLHTNPGEGNERISNIVKKKDGMAFSLDFKSSLPAKLPPIKITSSRIVQEDYEKWKETQDKSLMEKQEKAKIRREAVLQKRKIAAKRPKTAQRRDSREVDSFEG